MYTHKPVRERMSCSGRQNGGRVKKTDMGESIPKVSGACPPDLRRSRPIRIGGCRSNVGLTIKKLKPEVYRMPEKSIRDMSSFERRHHSLEARTFHAVLVGAAVLGLVAFVIGLGLYTYAAASRNVSEAFQLTRSAAAILQKTVDTEPLAADILKAYCAQSEEERAGNGTDEYRARFAPFTEREDFAAARAVLADFAGASDMDAIYLAMYDRGTSAMVYLVDPDESPETGLFPADWDPVQPKGLEHFLGWNGEGMLYEIGNTPGYGWLCTAGFPLRNGEGEIFAFVLADISLHNVLDAIKGFTLQYVLALGAATVLLGFLLSRHMKKALVKPINKIAQAAQDYAKDKRAGVRETEHFSRLSIRTGDEVENLSLVMADMERDLAEYVEDLTAATAEKERVSTELNMATQIQEGMLPNIYPAFPDRPEFDIYAAMDPAREVGGDFYDFFLVDDDHLCMVMADVSGKGVPAALFMMASKIILQNNAMMGKSPAQILTDTNAAVCANNKMEMFVTVWLGVLEISTGKLTAANAGHEYPVLKRADGGFELVKDKHGFVIGGMEGIRYKEYELTMEPGGKLFLYTDGVPEATDADQQLFGTERMLAALNGEPEASPVQVLKNVRQSVDGFVKEAEQFDDLTMLCLEYKGNRNPQM